jgi:hypothetical protein
MDPTNKMRRAISAIANALVGASFSDIIDSDRDAFKGLHVTYATKATEFHINQIRLDQLNRECTLVESFFDGSGLLFYSEDVHARTMAGQAKIVLDYSIMLDKNICEEIRRYVNGKQPSDITALAQLLRLVRGRRNEGFNYDYMAYLAEELEHFQQAGNDRPLQTFRALKRLDFLDESSLATYPKLATSPEVDLAVERATAEMIDEVIGKGALRQLQQNRLAAYAILLHAALLRWKGASVESAMESLVKFSIAALGKLAKIEIYFAWKLLIYKEPALPFFRPIANPSHKSITVIRGMSWDLSLFRVAEMLASVRRLVGGEYAEFFLPFIASSDRKFRNMVVTCPLRAIIVDHNARMVNSVFRDELEFQLVFIEAISRSGINNSDKAQAKRSASSVDERNLQSTILKLENEVSEASTVARPNKH